MPSISLRGLLIVVSALLCWPLMAADVEQHSDVELTLEDSGRDVTNSIGMKLVRIKAGKFLMGAAKDDASGQTAERPQHEVEITRPFYLGVTEVTQKQWRAVMGNNPSYHSRTGGGRNSVQNVADKDLENFPVEYVTWHDVQDYCKKLSALPAEKNAGRKYRLPTEAEWEYACRAGAKSYKKYSFGDEITPKLANYSGAGVSRTCKVASYAANDWGLFDMHGNVYEWIADWYDAGYYATSPKRDPQGPEKGANRVLRGGAWTFAAPEIRTSYRLSWGPENKNYDLGLRVVMVASR